MNAPLMKTDIFREKLPKTAGPQEVIKWTLSRFGSLRCVATTQFGMDGCAMLDMLARETDRIDVIYVDTDFLFEETYRLKDRMAERYPSLNFVRGHGGLSPEQQAAQYGDRLWARNPDQCCHLRKVLPMAELMADVDVWFTSIRRSQSLTRAATELVSWDWQYDVIKVCPMALWTKENVWEYVKKLDVPYNPMHHDGFPSIGCTHCTKRVEGAGITTDSRDGRWAGQAKTECGLHGGAGI